MIIDETASLLRVLWGDRINEITIERIVIGIFFTGVKLSDGSGGVAYTPTADLHDSTCCHSMAIERPASVPLKGMAVREVLEQPGQSILSNLVKLVVMNALSSKFITTDRYHIVYDADALDLVDYQEGGENRHGGRLHPFLEAVQSDSGNRPGGHREETGHPEGR